MGDDEIHPAISINISPQSRSRPLTLLQHPSLLFGSEFKLQLSRPTFIEIKLTSWRLRPAPGNHAPPNKEIQVPIPVKISRSGNTRTEGLSREVVGLRKLTSLTPTKVNAVAVGLISLWVLNAPTRDEKIEATRPKAYLAVGRLVASTLYTGEKLPLLHRVVDPLTGLTIAYVRPAPDTSIRNLLGQYVGVMGTKEYDPALKLHIIDAESIDALTPEGR